MTPKSKKMALPKGTILPNHIAVICDGNGRWARSRGLPVSLGHEAGAKALKELVRNCRDLGIHTLTVWGFSTENWNRPKKEVMHIMNLVKKTILETLDEAKRDGVRFIHLGRKDRLPHDVLSLITKAEEETKNNTKHVFNLALDYGGRDEILRAVKNIIKDRVSVDSLTEEKFASYLDTKDQQYPYPDLFIRTSGELRTSGYLPWQLTYAEFYFEEGHLPDINIEKLKAAILDYSRRRRRFGGKDKISHFKFDPSIVAKLELGWRHALAIGDGERFRDFVIKFVSEHYGLSKELAKIAGANLAKAIVYGEEENWKEAKKALKGLYEILKKTLNLAFEPDLVASIEVNLWRANGSAHKTEQGLLLEEGYRQLYAETFRVSNYQIANAAHLAALATAERDLAVKKSGKEANIHWKKAHDYTEKFYRALKERIA